MAKERLTPGLPDRIYMIDPAGHYYSMFRAIVIFTQTVPDLYCELIIEYVDNEPDMFYIRSWEGTYFEYAGNDVVTVSNSKSINSSTIIFTALDLGASDIFAFRTSNGKFLCPAVGHAADRLPLVTDAESAKIKVAEPVIRRGISNLVYDTASSTITELTPEIALTTTVRNDSDSENFTQALLYSYLVSEIGTWTVAGEISIAGKITVKTGIPFVFEGKVETTVTAKASLAHTSSTITTKTVTSTSTIAIGPKRTGLAIVSIKKAAIDVPFEVTERIWYRTGRFEEVTKKGVYRNVESYQVDVQVRNLVKIN